MADRNTKTQFVKAVFGIPDWYLVSEREEEKLFKYICEARTISEANLFRVMDCSTICDEQFCYFCASEEGEIERLCSACNIAKRD